MSTRRAHARTIARTEIARATQTAQLTAFEKSEVVPRKRWNTSLDALVRDSHQIDGQTVFLHEQFELNPSDQVGVEYADAPGVGDLSAANVINCRCFVTPVVE
jgi:hypothetical protein